LRQLQQASGLDRARLARRLSYSRSQLYEVLDGRVSRPPEWDRLVEPLVLACTGDDQRAVGEWRRRHEVLVSVYTELRRTDRQDSARQPVRAVPAQLPGDVPAFTGRTQELADLDRHLNTANQPGQTPQELGCQAAAGRQRCDQAVVWL
jgi:hypothetical protein